MSKVKITLEDLFDLPTAVIYNPDDYKPVTAVTIDSRNVPANSIFIAIKGERFDGHDFVKDAIKNGAKSIVINEKKLNQFDKIKLPIVTVKDTSKTLGDLAKIWRNKLSTKIISLTGSSGKTSTKEMMAIILSEKFKVNKTIANNNNHIGVPLTLFSTRNSHDVLVAEHGTNHFGEIEYTAKIAQPDYALITNIGNSHLEFLKNKKGVLKEKEALLKAADKNGGIVFINNDDKLLKGISKNYPGSISFGFDDEADVKGRVSGFTDSGNPEMEIKYKNKKLKLTLPLPGEHNALNFLSTAAVAFKLGMTKQQILSGVKKLKAIEKRLNVIKIKKSLIIDDTYNSNPDSLKYSVELLGKMNGKKKKVAVVGDMFELGKDAEKFHRESSKLFKKNNIDVVYSIGKLMKFMDEELDKTKLFHKHFKRRDSLKKHLTKFDLSNSIILVKGSRGMKMEDFLQTIKDNIK